MKNWNNFKIIEQSIKLSSKASDLERGCKDHQLVGLLHEVNLMALGIPQIIQANTQEDRNEVLQSALDVIHRLQVHIEGREELIEFAKLLSEENELLRTISREQKPMKKPVKASRLSIKDRTRVDAPLHVHLGVQGRLF